MKICKNCSKNFDTKFCPYCGTCSTSKRIDKHYLLHEIQHGVFHLENGFFYTTKELLTNPGNSIRRFIEGDRTKHFKPIGYLVATSILYVFIKHLFHFDELLELQNKDKVVSETYLSLLNWATEHQNYSNLFEIIFLATFTTILYRKKEYNFFEYFVLFTYLTGFFMLIGILGLSFTYFTNNRLFFKFSEYFGFIYFSWGLGKFLSENKWTAYIKTFFVYLISVISFFGLLLLSGIILDYIKINM
ncbi:MAG: DUF3667 domain-containing protein [Saprospiraceae bacterium]|nr:DUF3667 domain-containing protein [Saprospiraceae bacterium]